MTMHGTMNVKIKYTVFALVIVIVNIIIIIIIIIIIEFLTSQP
jgi:hypothetical protein